MKKIISLVLLVIIMLSLIGCTNAEYSEIINTAEDGKNPPELNIRYDAASKTLSWNKVDGVAAYVVQIGDYSQTINNNSVAFRENIENGIYTVTITPKGYKSVTTVFTVGVKEQNSYMETIIYIITVSVLTILLVISIIIIVNLKRNKNSQDRKINSLSDNELSKKVDELSREKKEYEKKLLYSENALKEALNDKLKSEQRLEHTTKELSIITSDKLIFKTKYLKAENELKETQKTLSESEAEKSKEIEYLKEKLQKTEEDLSKAKQEVASLSIENIELKNKIVDLENSLQRSKEEHNSNAKEIEETKKKSIFVLNENKDLKNKLADTKNALQKCQEEYKKTEELLNKTQKELSDAILQIGYLKAAPPKIEYRPSAEQIEELKNVFLKEQEEKEKKKNKNKDFRQTNQTPYRAEDGHPARSKSEREIDDFFFHNNIRHIYEKRYYSPITKKEYLPDYYLPDHNLIVEYFGMDDKTYEKQKNEKITAYKADKNVNFAYLDREDDYDLNAKLQRICREYNIPIKY